MKDSQFNVLLQMFAEMSKQITDMGQQITDLRQEMVEGFSNVRQEMAKGFSIQQAISQEVLNAVSGPFAELETEVTEIKTVHGKRLKKIERHIGLA